MTVLLAVLLAVAGPTWAERLGWLNKPRRMMGGSSRMAAVSVTPAMGQLTNANRPKTAFPKNYELKLSSATALPLFGPQTPPSPELPLAGQISPCLALTTDPVRGLLLTSSLDSSSGLLRWYDRDGLKLRGSCKLKGPAYHLAFDSKRGQLWAVTSVARVFTLSPLGDYEHAIANIHVYDLRTILDGSGPAVETLEPVEVLRERAPVSAFLLSADASRLFYLTQTESNAVVKRIDLQSRKCDKQLTCGGGGIMALTQAPGGATLYVLSSGNVYALDPNTMNLPQPVRVTGDGLLVSLCAGDGGRLFVSERRNNKETVVHAIDWSGKEPKPLASWNANLEGRIYLRTSPDGKRVYLGSSAVLNGEVRGVDVSTPRLDQPAIIGQALSNRERMVRGTLMVSPDGKYVVTGCGLVFRTES
jgi:hypothetical protein